MGAIGDVAAAITGGKGGLSPEDSNNIATLTENSSGFKDGITEVKSIAQKQLNYVSDIAVDVGERGWFAETLSKLVDNFEQSSQRDEEGQSLSESIKDILSDMKVFEETTAIDNKEKKKKKGKVSDRTKLDDLKSLPYEYATLGAVLANVLSNKDEKKDKKGGISGFFKGLLEGISGIAALGAALLAFAGATLIFNFVDWGAAVIGLLAFTAFTIGMVVLAKNLKGEKKNLIEFAEASLIMSAALGVFAVSLWIASALFTDGISGDFFGQKIDIPAISAAGAAAALVTFGIFELGMVGLAKLVGTEKGTFLDFAKGSILMSVAMVTFAIALLITSHIFSDGINLGSFGETLGWTGPNGNVKIDPAGALEGILVFLAFEVGLAAIARIVGSEAGTFTKFAAGSILMSAALVAFALSLVITSHIVKDGIHIGDIDLPAVDMTVALQTVGLFVGFMAAMAILGAAAQSVLAPMAILSGVSILMSLALISFSTALAITNLVMTGGTIDLGEAGSFTLPKIEPKAVLEGLALMGAFMAGFAALGAVFLIPFAGQAMALGIATASAIMISIAIATTLFAKAMALASGIVTGGNFEIEGKKYSLQPYNDAATQKMFEIMSMFIDKFAQVADDIGIKGAIAVSILAKSVMPIVDAMDKMLNIVIRAAENKDKVFEIVGDSNALDHLMDPVLMMILGSKLDGNGGLMAVANGMSIKGAIVLRLVTESLVPIVNAMNTMIDVVIKAADNKDAIDTILKGDTNAIDHLLDPVLWMILGQNLDGSGGLMNVANHMSKRSAEVLKLVTEAMTPMVDAMDKMIDVVLKAATLSADGMTTEELVALSMKNLNLILVGDPSGTGFIPMFVQTAWALDDTSKKAVEAIKAMPSMVQSLSDLVDVIAKAGELDPTKINNGIFGLNAANTFLKTFITTINDIIPGGVGGFLSGVFGGDPLDKLKDAHEYLQPGGLFYNIFQDLANIAKNFDGQGFENLGKVSVVGTFTTDMLKGSDNFKDIMKNIQKGIDNLSNPQAMTTVANALENISNAGDISHKFDPIYELIEKSVSIHSTAQDLESIANSYNKIAAAEKIGDMSSKFKGVFGIKSSTPSTTAAPAAVANNNRSSGMSIEEILNDWYENGVKIKQNLEGLPEEPKPVNLLSID